MKNENSLNEAGLDSKIELSDEIAILNEIEYYNTEFPKPSQESWNWNEICLKNQLEFDPRQILEYPKEKRIELITMYHLENDAVDVFENIILNNGDYIEKMKKYSEIKNGFLGIIDKDDIENEVERIKKYVSNNDTEYVDLLTECSLARDTGYKKLEDDGIAYTYFLSMKNCRKYVSENLGYIQIYGRSGLYNIHSKTIDDYRKSKDMLKRIKVLQIKVKKTKRRASPELYQEDETQRSGRTPPGRRAGLVKPAAAGYTGVQIRS